MKKCIVCNGDAFEQIYKDILQKCSICGFVRAGLEFGRNDLREVYSKKYFEGEEYFNYQADKSILQLNFKRRLKHFLKKVDERTVTNVLELGCAYGFFAEIINKCLKIGYIGFDVVPEAVAYGREQLRQNLVCCDYLDYEVPPDTYSDVFMWDVIEHLPDPDEVMMKISTEIKTGGRLCLTTGDFESLLSRLQGARWRMVHPPSHIQYFSPKTIAMFLSNYGFDVLKISYTPVYRSVQQIFYSLCLLNKNPGTFIQNINDKIPSAWYLKINTFDIMEVVAVKGVKNL